MINLTELGCALILLFGACYAICPQGCSSCQDGRYMCPGIGLTAIPASIPSDTFTLDFTQNNIDSLSRLPSLPEAQSFRISLNKLRVITGEAFENLPSLVSLDLGMNDIVKVYKHGFRGLDSLVSLSLNGNKMTDLGSIFRNTPALTTLRLGNNQIERIEEDTFKKTTLMRMLDLSHNKITYIHGNAFKDMEYLRYLILSNNPVTTLTDLSFNSRMLSLADFSNCQLESVPRTMPPSLTDFRLGNNKIQSVNVEDFENITELTLLTLNDNQITHVAHRSFETLNNLEELWLSRNSLVYIPRGLPQNLSKLFIDHNEVVELEPMLFKEDSQLKVLSLENNKVIKVHQDSLKKTRQLEKLNLQGNKITLIDIGTFTDLPKLNSLTLTNNPIEVFESGAFSGLDNLTYLSLSYVETKLGNSRLLYENFLTAMPNLTSLDLMSSFKLTKELLADIQQSGMKPLSKLQKINLQYNELTTLPTEVQNAFPNIKQFLLDGNLLRCDQQLLWLHNWMQTRDVSFHQYEQVTCNSPEALRGRLVSELKSDDFTKVPPEESSHTPEQSDSKDETSIAAQSNTNQPVAKPEKQQPVDTSYAPVPSRTIGGVKVIIKPPSGTSSRELSKEERKALRKAQRQLKRRQKQQQKKTQRSKSQQDRDNKRKKRRIRNKGKRCRTDKNGEKKCEMRKRCKVDDAGNVVCRKRGGKKKKNSSKN